MKNNGNIMCDQCKKSVPMSDAKYSPKGPDSVMVVCSDCRSRVSKKNKPKEVMNEIKTIIEKPRAVVNSSKKSFSCTRCNYKFKYDYGSDANLRCPYCGKMDYLVKSYDFSAEKLVKESKE